MTSITAAAPPDSVQRRSTSWRPSITIELRRNGADIERTYHDPVYGPRFPGKQPIDSIGGGYKVGTVHGLAAIESVLYGEDVTDLSGDQLIRAGRVLFEALFGSDESHWELVLRAAFRQADNERTAPTRYPLRVRIYTSDALLVSLPWSAARWNNEVLSDAGWTFEVGRAIRTDVQIEHQAPGRILFVASWEPSQAAAGAIDANAHWEELKELIGSFSRAPARPNDLRMARTCQEIIDIVQRMQPEVVYYYGTAAMHEGQLYLQVGAAPSEWILARELAELLRGARVKALFLNARWTAQANPSASCFPLFSHIPLVLAGPACGSAPDAPFALQWFRRWLRERRDPVAAAHPLPGQSGVFPTRGIFMAQTLYDAWTTRGQPLPHDIPDRAEDWFDRDRQRAIAYKHIADLTRHRNQRAEAVVVYGSPGNSLEKISRQIMDYIEQEAGERIHILRVTVALPIQRSATWDAGMMEQSLKSQLGFGPEEPLKAVLAAKAPRITHNAARVLWLDWQVLRGLESFSKELYAWLEFVRDRIATACPEGIRVVAALALEADGTALQKLKDRLPSFRSRPELRTDHFRCTVLDPLDTGTLVDIVDFLDRHGCAQGVLNDVAQAIFDKTQGRYEDTAALLREGLTHGWHALLHRLGKVSRPDDF